MTRAASIIRKARAAGVNLTLSPTGNLSFAGDAEALERLKPELVAHKAAILAELRREEDAAKRRLNWWTEPVREWRDGKLQITNLASGKSFWVDLLR